MKTVTYTMLDCRDFDDLVEEHLGIKSRVSRTGQVQDGEWDGMQQDLLAHQDTYVIFESDPARWEESEYNYTDWVEHLKKEGSEYDTRSGYGALTHKLAADLFKKGIFPAEHDVFVQVWW